MLAQSGLASAQRLTASKVEELNHHSGQLVRHCGVLNALRHQRLKNLSPFSFYGFHDVVLNAFRHQRLKNIFKAQSWARLNCAQRLAASKVEELAILGQALTDLLVLNAFRHQRLKNFRIYRGQLVTDTCSTPFGIRG